MFFVGVASAAVPPLVNPGFEGPARKAVGTGDRLSSGALIVGQIAEGWEDNSGWADVDVEYALDQVNPHRGTTSQRITVKRVTSGAVQFVQPVDFEKDRAYLFRVWLRGSPGRRVELILRKAGAPYTAYASESVGLAAEWQECRVAGVVPEQTRGFLMIRTTAPQTFWVDDASLEDLSEVLAKIPPKEGNLIDGGSFEAGVSFGWSVRIQGAPDVVFADRRPTTDDTIARVGKRSLRVDIPSGGHTEIQSPMLELTGGREYSAAFWARSSRPGTDIWVHFQGTNIGTGARLGTDWQKLSMRGRVNYLPATWLKIVCTPREDLTLWIDGVQVEEKAQPSGTYSQRFPCDLVMRLDRPGHVVFDREPVQLEVSVAPEPPGGSKVRFSCQDILGGEHRVPELKLPASSFALPDFPQRRRGLFKLRGVVVDQAGRELSAPAELIWARLPRPRDVEPEKSFMGTHIPFARDFAAIARAVGTRWVRTHDTSMIGKWPIAEPERGKWAFYDEAVDTVVGAGLAILGMLDGAPARVSTKKREGGYWSIWHIPDAPGAIEEWKTYVRTVVGHYRGRIDHWEIWNEPWGEWWTGAGGTPELYGEFSRAAYSVAKEANPNVCIVGIDTYPGHEWTEKALAAVRPDHFDAFSFHDYQDTLFGGIEAAPFVNARRFKELQAKYGTPKPLWNTEGGLFAVGSWYAPSTGGLPAREQLAYIVRYDVTYMAAGVKRFFLYGIHSDPAMGETMCRVTEHDRAIKPILAARAVLAWLVDGSGIPTRSEPVAGVDAYEFPPERGRSVTVLWSYDGEGHRLPVPKGAEVLDVLGNPVQVRGGSIEISHEPVYLLKSARGK